MQTKSNILFLSTMLLLVLSSCVKEPGEFEPHLNVVSLISPGNGFQVVVSKTAPAIGNHNNLGVINAIVSIENNETQEVSILTHSRDGIYTSAVSPLSGFDYEVQVKAPGFEIAAATTYIPDLNDVNDLVVNVTEEEIGDDKISITFSPRFISNTSSSYFAYELMYFEEERPEVEIPLPQGNTSPIDKGESNTSYLLPIVGEISDGSPATINSLNTLNAKGEPTNIDNVSIRIVAVSPQYHAYLMDENDIEQTHYSSSHYNQNGIFSNFTDGAFGIFGGFNERTIKLSQ